MNYADWIYLNIFTVCLNRRKIKNFMEWLKILRRFFNHLARHELRFFGPMRRLSHSAALWSQECVSMRARHRRKLTVLKKVAANKRVLSCVCSENMSHLSKIRFAYNLKLAWASRECSICTTVFGCSKNLVNTTLSLFSLLEWKSETK